MICRILVQSFKTSQAQNQSFQNEASTIASNIQQGIYTSAQLINLNSIQQDSPSKIPLKGTTERNVIDLSSPQDNLPTNITESTPQPNTLPTIQRLQDEINLDGNFISDDAITRTIEVVRSQNDPAKIFIAHGLSNLNINSWAPTQGWERFSRIFNSRTATFSKPNGTYMIPIFSGNSSSGHWHLVVIKNSSRTLCHGWVLDSLGRGQTSSNTINKITEAFSHSSRGCVIWNAPQCLRQTENECGPRTLKGIIDICENLGKGVSIADSITCATMCHLDHTTYSANAARRETATVLSSHLIDLSSRTVTFRQSGGKTMAARSGSRKRAPRKVYSKVIVLKK